MVPTVHTSRLYATISLGIAFWRFLHQQALNPQIFCIISLHLLYLFTRKISQIFSFALHLLWVYGLFPSLLASLLIRRAEKVSTAIPSLTIGRGFNQFILYYVGLLIASIISPSGSFHLSSPEVPIFTTTRLLIFVSFHHSMDIYPFQMNVYGISWKSKIFILCCSVPISNCISFLLYLLLFTSPLLFFFYTLNSS